MTDLSSTGQPAGRDRITRAGTIVADSVPGQRTICLAWRLDKQGDIRHPSCALVDGCRPAATVTGQWRGTGNWWRKMWSQCRWPAYKAARVLIAGIVLAGLSLASMHSINARQAGGASVRFVQASPDAPDLDIYIGGNLMVSLLPYQTASEYMELPAGDHRVQVTVSGEHIDASIVDTEVTLESDQWYSLVTANLFEDLALVEIVDQTEGAGAESAQAQFLHFAPGAPDLDISEASNGSVEVSALAYGATSGYLELEAGVHDFDVLLADSGEGVLEVSGIEMDSQFAYSIYLMGVIEDESFTAVPFVDREVNIADPTATPSPEASAEATAEPTATMAAGLPETGSGGTAGGGDRSWPALIAALSAVAIILSGFAVLFRNRRQET